MPVGRFLWTQAFLHSRADFITTDTRHILKPKNLPLLLLAAFVVPFTDIFMASDMISQIVAPEIRYGYIMAVGVGLYYDLPAADFCVTSVYKPGATNALFVFPCKQSASDALFIRLPLGKKIKQL